MGYSQLKAFHNVAVLKSFSRAAEAMLLTQPAVSEQVRKLEQHHDVLLFHREKKKVWLTEAGEKLYRLTKQFFEIEQEIEDFLSESSQAVTGELRIIADSAHHVTAILRRFQKRYPDITISLRVGNSEEILDELRSYDAEIGVIGNPSPGRDVEILNLSTTEIVAFAACDLLPDEKTTLTIKELAEFPLIYREQGSKTRQKLEETAAAQGVSLHPSIVAEGREAVREVVASGAGIGFVSLAEFGNDERVRPLRLVGADIEMSETLVDPGHLDPSP